MSDPESALEGLHGVLQGADGSSLEATLAPLHADPRRQAFERGALSRVLALEEGEPWRLSLRWLPPASPEGASTANGGLDLGAVEVRDGVGLALKSLELQRQQAPAAVEGAPVDPVVALLAPPKGALRQGQAADWILWGRAPGDGAWIAGLLPDPDLDPAAAEAVARETALRGELRLQPFALRTGEWHLPLARADRPGVERPASDSGAPARKSAAPDASETGREDAPHGSAPDERR